LAGKRLLSKPTTIKPDKPTDTPVPKHGVDPLELERTYVLAQRIYRALPTITEAQLREYFLSQSAMRAASYTMFKQLTARETTVSEFAGISLVNDTTIALRAAEYTEQEQLAILGELKSKLDVLSKQAVLEKKAKAEIKTTGEVKTNQVNSQAATNQGNSQDKYDGKSDPETTQQAKVQETNAASSNAASSKQAFRQAFKDALLKKKLQRRHK
jgi:hypothetical protein